MLLRFAAAAGMLALAGAGLAQQPWDRDPSDEEYRTRRQDPAKDAQPEHVILPPTVSVQQLQHRTPRKAQKALTQANEDFAKRRYQQSIAHLEEALQIDPGSALAHNMLGANYGLLNQHDRAVGEFQKALELDPQSESASSNLGIALMSLGRYDEAEQAARRALRVNPAVSRMHFLLAFCLRNLNRGGQEALQHFERAAAEFPRARLYAAEILMKEERRSEAADQLRQYLRSPAKTERSEVEAVLARLEKQPASPAPAR